MLTVRSCALTGVTPELDTKDCDFGNVQIKRIYKILGQDRRV